MKNMILDEIESIEYMGEQDTIDIDVSDNHLFWANDILTHNSSVQEQEHDHSMIAGGISKIQTADNVISIFASAAMKERGQYQIQFLKTRSSSGVGSKVYLGFDPNTLRIFDLDDDAAAAANNTNGADVFTELRRKNNVSKKDTVTNVTVPTTSATELASLRSLIRR